MKNCLTVPGLVRSLKRHSLEKVSDIFLYFNMLAYDVFGTYGILK
jgi:hypothetical protein